MQGRRITELEADNAQLSVEVTSLRLRPRLPQPSAALNQLVGALGLHEQDLRVRAGVHLPRYLARCTDDLPPNPGVFCHGRRGRLHVVRGSCAGVPASVAMIADGGVDDVTALPLSWAARPYAHAARPST